MRAARVSAAWGAGLLVAWLFGDAWYYTASVLFVVVTAAVLRGYPHPFEGFVLPIALLIAGVCYVQSIPVIESDSAAIYTGLPRVVVEAVVMDEPEIRAADTRFRVRAEAIDTGSARRPVSGDVLVTTTRLFAYEPGDRLEIEGRLRLPNNFGDFDYRAYLLRKGVVADMLFPRIERIGSGELSPVAGAIFDLREGIAARLDRALPAESAGLAQGVLVGRAPSLTPATKEQLRATGLSHLVVVSGQNVTLVGAITAAALAWLIGRRKALVVGIAIAWAYAGLAGFSPPVFRAVVMVTLAFSALLLGRPGSGVGALGIAAVILTAIEPQLIHDVAFQLSFAAMVGLMFLSEPLGRLIIPDEERRGPARVLAETAAVSLAATIATLPIQLYHFDRVSLVSMVANLLVVPAFPLMILSAAVTAVLGLASSGFAELMAPVLALPFRWFALVARTLGSFDFAAASGAAGLLAATAIFGALVLAAAAMRYSSRWSAGRAIPAWVGAGGVAGLAAVAVALWAIVLTGGTAGARIDVLDVGAGQAVLVQTADGQTILIDGGEDGGRLLQQLNEALGTGTRRLDAIVVTSGRSDHMAGLIDVVDRYDVETLVVPPGDASTFTERWLRRSFEAAGTAVIEARPGLRFRFGEGSVAIIAVSNETDTRGAAVLATMRGLPMLIPGGVPLASLQWTGAVAGALTITPGRQFSPLLLDIIGAPALVVTDRDPVVLPDSTAARVALWATETNGRLTFAVSGEGVSLAADR